MTAKPTDALTWRTRAKRVVQSVLPSRYPPLVVASMGRAGSTLVHSAIRDAMAQARFGTQADWALRLVAEPAWDLAQMRLQRGVAYKTHALAAEWPWPPHGRVVFLFGRASAAAISVYACERTRGRAWIRRHFRHLRASGPLEDLAHRDVLHFAQQLQGWHGLSGVPRLLLRYDAIWDHADVLSRFCGFPVRLPPQRERRSRGQVAPEIIRACERSYADLDARIDSRPDYEWLE